MRNTHGWRILEETKDYIIMYTQFGKVDCWGKLRFAQCLNLTTKVYEEMYLEENVFTSSNVPKTGKEEEKYLKRSVKKLLKRMKKGKK